MASGQRRVVFNNRERAVSNDLNRVGDIAAAYTAEILRYMLLAVGDEGGATSTPSTTTSPTTGLIISGLWARPEIGTVNLFIEKGVAVIANPDGLTNPDDSPIKVINSDGVSTAGALTLTAGAVDTRIDVIECTRSEVAQESDSRDVFDPVTGLFTPTVVTKVMRSVFLFRIRLGTPGAGYPGNQSGWLPLAVASVPSTATTWNDCILWDVRPLMSDLARGPSQVQTRFPDRTRQYGTLRLNGGARELRGFFETELNQWRVGGEIGSSLSGLATGMLDLAGADVIEPSFTPVGDTPWFLYCIFPHSLPRWARYSPSSSGVRQPLPFNGIPVLSQKNPNTARGIRTSSNINVPTPLGLGGGTTNNVVLVTGAFDTAITCLSSMYADGWTKLSGPVTTISPASGAGTNTIRFDLTDNTHFPLGAVMLRVRFSFTVDFTAAGTNMAGQTILNMLDSGAIVLASEIRRMGNLVSDTTTDQYIEEYDVPIDAVASMPTGTAQTHRFQFITTFLGVVTVSAWTNQTLQVVGWRMGW